MADSEASSSISPLAPEQPAATGGGRRNRLKTAFPSARIKKIMQTDEEVGRLASAIPPLVSKCTELFMEDLINKTADIAKQSKSKVITPSILKMAITSTEHFDFLKEKIASKISDSGASASSASSEAPKQRKKAAPKAAADGKEGAASSRKRKSKAAVDEEDEDADDLE